MRSGNPGRAGLPRYREGELCLSCIGKDRKYSSLKTSVFSTCRILSKDFIVKTDLALGFEERGGHVTGCFNSPGEQGSEGPHQEECPS